MPVRAPGRVSAEDNGRPKAEGKSSFSTTFYRIFSAQQTDSSSSGLPLSISKDKPSSPEKEMNTHLETSFLNWPTDYHHGMDFLAARVRGVAVVQGCAVERYTIMVPRFVSRPRVRPGFPLAGRVEELFVVAQPSVTPCSAMCVSSITP